MAAIDGEILIVAAIGREEKEGLQRLIDKQEREGECTKGPEQLPGGQQWLEQRIDTISCRRRADEHR
jgi:hypothetical protein